MKISEETLNQAYICQETVPEHPDTETNRKWKFKQMQLRVFLKKKEIAKNIKTKSRMQELVKK